MIDYKDKVETAARDKPKGTSIYIPPRRGDAVEFVIDEPSDESRAAKFIAAMMMANPDLIHGCTITLK